MRTSLTSLAGAKLVMAAQGRESKRDADCTCCATGRSDKGSAGRASSSSGYEDALVTTCIFLAGECLTAAETDSRVASVLRAALRQLARRCDHPEAWIELSTTMSQPSRAIPPLRRALRRAPNHPQAHCELAKLMVALGRDHQSVRRHCEKVLQYARRSVIGEYLLFDVCEIAEEMADAKLVRRIRRAARQLYAPSPLFPASAGESGKQQTGRKRARAIRRDD
ncbi:MAG: hypothetical protein CHACPFDD_02797 [Phycisphaerae bacterium]|nr:hypothetical protein [Phycisphaerae bacterium]